MKTTQQMTSVERGMLASVAMSVADNYSESDIAPTMWCDTETGMFFVEVCDELELEDGMVLIADKRSENEWWRSADCVMKEYDEMATFIAASI